MTLDAAFLTHLSRYLPRDLLEQLPDSQALTTAIRRLNSLHQAVSSFLPQYIADNEALHTQSYGELRPGTFMFADVSGFTALSEKLQREGGPEGPEILTEIINDYFATMLEILAKSNGQLLKFAGDALLTFFPSTGNEDEAPQAIRTGLRMQRAMMAKFQPISHSSLTNLLGQHTLQLTMSIGISRGKLFEALVGNTVQRDHIIQGTLPGQAMSAEAAGDRDDVIIDAELQAAYRSLFETVAVADGFYRVVDHFGDQLDDYEFVVPRRRRAQVGALFDHTETNLLDDLHHHLERLDHVARFVAPEVVNKLAFKGDHIESEHRPATVIFMYFAGFAELLMQWGEEQIPLLTSILERYYGIMQRIITNNGGSLTRSDPYQRGVKLLITFGAPVAHPDDPERAVATALEMNRQLALFNARIRDELPETLSYDPPITQRIGITHGHAFAGEVGWKARREYTVMGDDVNLAARLMGKGEMGQILVSMPVWKRVNPHFETEELPPLQLKGKSRPVQPYLVKATSTSALDTPVTSDTPFIGRDLQLISLTYALQQAKGPRRRQALALVGEIGVGKTRMAKHLAQAAEKSGFVVAWAGCQQRHTQNLPVCAVIISQLLQLDQAKSEEAQRRLLNVRLNELGLSDLESIFCQLLFDKASRSTQDAPAVSQPAASPDKTQPKSGRGIFQVAQEKGSMSKSGIFGMTQRRLNVDQTTPEDTSLWQTVEKRTSFADSMVRFFQVFTEEAPTLLVLDDLHQGDPQTLAILRQILTEITKGRLVVLVTYEPSDGLELNIRRTTPVSDLSPDETLLMGSRILGADLGPQLNDLLWEQTGGRPLFVESLLRLLQEGGFLEQVPNGIELKGEGAINVLPDDIRGLVISQLDRLPPESQVVLQAAAVLGQEFPPTLLAVLSEIENPSEIETILCSLCKAQIIDTQRGTALYRFRYGVTRQAVYASLNRLQRQKLHRAAADFLSHQPDADSCLPEIAYHLVKSGMPTRALGLISDAAEKAEQQGQIDNAIELYRDALAIFPNDESLRTQIERLSSETK